MTYYYLLQFTHAHNNNMMEFKTDELDNSIDQTSSILRELLLSCGMKSKHAYIFPLDDIYKYIMTTWDDDEVFTKVSLAINRAILNKEISRYVKLVLVSKQAPDSDPYKQVDTLAEYMNN